jgi:hypothetical protein
MLRSSSDEQSRAIDEKLPEDTMLFSTIDYLQAETAYRQERLKRDYQRPGWFHRKPAQEKARWHRATIRARHA